MNSPTPPVEDVLTRLSKSVEDHRLGEAISGFRVSHCEAPVDALESALKVIEALRTDLQRAREALKRIAASDIRNMDTLHPRAVPALAKDTLNTISSGPDRQHAGDAFGPGCRSFGVEPVPVSSKADIPIATRKEN